jgi:hypothetical protein
MDTALWIIQGGLALLFLGSGLMKAFASKRTGQPGAVFYETSLIRFVALCEIAGAVALVVPWLTGFVSTLTPVAASCLAVLRVVAAESHGRLAGHVDDERRRRKEMRNLAGDVVILAACLLVAIGRGYPPHREDTSPFERSRAAAGEIPEAFHNLAALR